MSAPYSYENGAAVLRAAGNIYAFGADQTIALAFDSADGTLLRHGRGDLVDRYARDYRATLEAQPLGAMLLDGFEVIHIPVKNLAQDEVLAELNAAIEIAGRVRELPRRLTGILAPAGPAIH